MLETSPLSTALGLIKEKMTAMNGKRQLIAVASLLVVLINTPGIAQESQSADGSSEDSQAALNKALDSTATQWSFQFSYQVMPDYHQDTLDNGETRPVGSTDYIQLRLVAPVPLKSLTILPRLTFRHYENAKGQSGLGNTELFALIIPNALNWGSGRAGVGPLVTFPGNEDVARDEWGYGVAAAAVNGSGPWFYGLLFTQSWQSIDPTALPPGKSDTNPLGIAPFLNFQLGGGWYIGNGDMVALYDWGSNNVLRSDRRSLRQGYRQREGELEHLRGVPDQLDLQELSGARG